MLYEVDFTVIKNNQHISLKTALIHALNVTECKDLAGELASEIKAPKEGLIFDIHEIEQ